MTPILPPARSIRPPDATPPDAARSSGALGALLAGNLPRRAESKRVTIALIVLLVVGSVVLNLVVWKGTQSHLLNERWSELAAQADGRRQAIRDRVRRVESEAGTVLRNVVAPLNGRLASAGDPESRRRLEQALAGEARSLGFASIRLMTRDGTLLAGGPAFLSRGPERDRALVEKATTTGRPVASAVGGANVGGPWVVLAVPADGEPGSGVALVVETTIDDLVGPPHVGGRLTGAGGGVYLAVGEGQRVTVLGTMPAELGLRSGRSVVVSAPPARAAALAAQGAESQVVSSGEGGPYLWAVTRSLPELDAGLAVQVDRSVMLRGTEDTAASLLALDFGMALLAAAAIWMWRRRLVTELVQRELAFTRHQADRVKAVFDTVFDAILVFDAAGRVHSANRAAEALFTRTAQQMEGEPVPRFLRCGSIGRSGTFEPSPLDTLSRSEGMRADGSVIPVEFSLACAGDGEQRIYTAVVRDISDQVQAESRIQSFAEGLEVTNRRLEEANAQLEEASRLKSEFLANTSHELRTPLNGMIGFLQLVLDGMCESPEEERDFLNQALQCSRRLLGLINDVLDIAKIEAGKLSLDVEAVDVHALFGDVYTLTHVQAAQKGITLKFEAPERCTYPVRGDFGKIKQVLLNLVGNSIKFTSRGSIEVRATERAELGHYEFEVIDTGIGIPPERQKLIFEKFTQGDGSTTRRFGGTGLGLAISRSLVELMGGIITVHSDGAGKGTSMYFSLPVWRNPEEQDDPDGAINDRIEGPAGGSLVLLVEDDAVFRKLLTTLLHQHGYRTVEAASAEAGWLLARRMDPAVVVLDYALSCAEGANLRTGWDLAERMAGDPKTRQIPLVFVTGFDLQLRDKLGTTILARQPEHMMKPVDGRALVAKIEEVLGGPREGVARILLADDDPAVAAFVQKVLPDGRFHLEIANNGEECLHILRLQPRGYDLLILDLMMPDVSGYDVLRELTLLGSAADLPVLILTNFPEARNEEEKRLLERGLVLDVIPKSSVHENPMLLPHVIDWHLQVAAERDHAGGAEESGEVDDIQEAAA
jgi:PAS domain S-box-containing protein